MKKKIVFLFLLFLTLNSYGIKFFVGKDSDKKITLQGIFSFGVSQSAAKDLFGLTEYQSAYFKFGFCVEDFGFLYNLDIRFRLFAEKPVIYEKDWVVLGNPLQTFFLYVDKIEYLKYGNDKTPIYFTTGLIPYLNFGSGLVVNSFHNRFFLPVARENGFYFKFDGKRLDKFKTNKIPVDFTFFITDLLDPDILGLNASVDIFEFTKISKDFSLKTEYTAITDLDANEKNRLSSLDSVIDSGGHRNLISKGFSSCIFINSFSLNFTYRHKFFILKVYNESAFLFDLYDKYNHNFRFGFGNKFGTEGRFAEIKDSGFLIGINFAIIGQTSNFIFDYFSSNYEIVRKTKYANLPSSSTVAINAGFTLYALNDNLKFHAGVTVPFEDGKIKTKFLFKFTLEKLEIKGQKNLPEIYINSVFESGINEIKVSGTYKDENGLVYQGIGGTNGEYFLTTFTNEFRFFSEIGFKMYGAKIGLIIGMQKPASVFVDYGFTKTEGVGVTSNINLGKYNEDIQKFVRLEVAFVF
ncbi:MAG TPA: hypothetical protein PLO89_01475 [Spirochaetota bacterium]|nr:hypothetical protein [Spirochaetota bacterium]